MAIDRDYIEARKREAEAQRDQFFAMAHQAIGSVMAFDFLLKELDKPAEPPQD